MALMHRYQVEIGPDSFGRLNTTDLATFFAIFDPAAGFETIAPLAVAPVMRSLLNNDRPRVLDLMAGSDTHLGATVTPERVVGVGPCRNAMDRNAALGERIVQDLDADPKLPFADASFDLVICTGAVAYLARPRELFADAARVLDRDGVMLVIFDNRAVEERVIKAWRRGSEEEHLALVDYYLKCSGGFGRSQARVSKMRDVAAGGRPVYAVFAIRSETPKAADIDPELAPMVEHRYSPEEIAERKLHVGETLRCPYCDHPLTEAEIPDTPFCEWDTDRLWVCFAADCPYTLRSLHVMRSQGNLGVAYRAAYHRERDRVFTLSDTSFGDRG